MGKASIQAVSPWMTSLQLSKRPAYRTDHAMVTTPCPAAPGSSPPRDVTFPAALPRLLVDLRLPHPLLVVSGPHALTPSGPGFPFGLCFPFYIVGNMYI